MTPSLSPPARLVLIRHAETVGNLQQRWTGWSHTPVSELGHEQIRRTAARLAEEPCDYAALYSSPLERAWETAGPIGRAVGRQPIRVEALKEMHFGELESIQSDEFASEHPEIYRQWQRRTDDSFGWPGGETRQAFRQRVADGLGRLAADHSGEMILIVTHSGVIRMALAHFVPQQYSEWWQVRLGNCSLTHLVLGGAVAEVPVLNDMAHLQTIS
jgi:broad specificity phosphatase PhoE